MNSKRFLGSLLAIIMASTFLVATQVYIKSDTEAMVDARCRGFSDADIVAIPLFDFGYHGSDALARLMKVQNALNEMGRVTDISRFAFVESRAQAHDRSINLIIASNAFEHEGDFYLKSGTNVKTVAEVVLPENVASALGVSVNDTIDVGRDILFSLRVVGISANAAGQRMAFADSATVDSFTDFEAEVTNLLAVKLKEKPTPDIAEKCKSSY